MAKRAATSSTRVMSRSARRVPGLVRHNPQDTVLYRVVEEHLDEFLRIAREVHGPLPAFIKKTFRAYLDCGRPERGCIR